MASFWLSKEVIEKANEMLSKNENIDHFQFDGYSKNHKGVIYTITDITPCDKTDKYVGKRVTLEKPYFFAEMITN